MPIIDTPWYVVFIPVHNAHPHFPLKDLGKKCSLDMANDGIFYTERRSADNSASPRVEGMRRGEEGAHKSTREQRLGLPLKPSPSARQLVLGASTQQWRRHRAREWSACRGLTPKPKGLLLCPRRRHRAPSKARGQRRPLWSATGGQGGRSRTGPGPGTQPPAAAEAADPAASSCSLRVFMCLFVFVGDQGLRLQG